MPKKSMLTVEIPEDLHHQLKIAAATRRTTIVDIVTAAILAELKKKGAK